MNLLCSVLVCVSLTLTAASPGTPPCDLAALGAGDSCKAPWGSFLKGKMHPTQPLLGLAWVQYKADAHMGGRADAQGEMDSKIVPVCKGPGNGLWILDHHHLLAALDYSGLVGVSPTVHVVCDFSSSTTTPESFWAQLRAKELTYLKVRPDGNSSALPTETVDWRDLPTVINMSRHEGSVGVSLSSRGSSGGFRDDPWRSLVGFSRKIKGSDCPHGDKYCRRAFTKACNAHHRGIPFFEFRWSYFFNDAYLRGPDALWGGVAGYATFADAYRSLKPFVIGKGDTDEWSRASEYLVALARSEAASEYEVPVSQKGCKGRLPGQITASGNIDTPDPVCDLPLCSDFPPSATNPSVF